MSPLYHIRQHFANKGREGAFTLGLKSGAPCAGNCGGHGLILVTGASGNIGARLVGALHDAGEDVVGITRQDVDLADCGQCKALPSGHAAPDTVVHLAGRAKVGLVAPDKIGLPPKPSNHDIAFLYRDNVLATANVVQYCLEVGVKRLVFASSQKVYGIPAQELVQETDALAPLEHYAASKVAAEQLLRMASWQGLSVTCLRFPSIFGASPAGATYGFFQQAIERRHIEVEVNFALPYDVLHIEDLVEAFKKTINLHGRRWTVLNVATGEPCSLDLLADDVADIVGDCTVQHALVRQVPMRMSVVQANRMLGWRAQPRRTRLQQVFGEIAGAT